MHGLSLVLSGVGIALLGYQFGAGGSVVLPLALIVLSGAAYEWRPVRHAAQRLWLRVRRWSERLREKPPPLIRHSLDRRYGRPPLRFVEVPPQAGLGRSFLSWQCPYCGGRKRQVPVTDRVCPCGATLGEWRVWPPDGAVKDPAED